MRVLAIGAHPDDVEFGCGGTLLRHRLAGDAVTLLVMTTGERGPDAEMRIREQEQAASVLGAALCWGGFVDGAVPVDGDAVGVIEHVISAVAPVVIYTHAPQDTHQDHRATSAAALAAARRISRVLCFESPSSIGFSPTVYVDIAGLLEAKLDLLRTHMSQVLRLGSLVDLEAAESQARYRGFAARVREAEAFESHRFLWDPVEVRGASRPAAMLNGLAEDVDAIRRDTTVTDRSLLHPPGGEQPT
ncbi:MAG: PIG-L deacetylase family protein [Acidimicrobiales bacterium]|jgi:LmbE family N-acetylglucosaminyl deacetylase